MPTSPLNKMGIGYFTNKHWQILIKLLNIIIYLLGLFKNLKKCFIEIEFLYKDMIYVSSF